MKINPWPNCCGVPMEWEEESRVWICTVCAAVTFPEESETPDLDLLAAFGLAILDTIPPPAAAGRGAGLNLVIPETSQQEGGEGPKKA